MSSSFVTRRVLQRLPVNGGQGNWRQLEGRQCFKMSSEPIQSYHSCVVVGAGLAGLYAAQQLKDRYPDVLVVEAQDHVGGRVRQVNMFMPTLQSSRCAMCHMSIASQFTRLLLLPLLLLLLLLLLLPAAVLLLAAVGDLNLYSSLTESSTKLLTSPTRCICAAARFHCLANRGWARVCSRQQVQVHRDDCRLWI